MKKKDFLALPTKNNKMNIKKFLAVASFVLAGCGAPADNFDVVNEHSDASDIIRTESRLDSRICSNIATVWPEWEETATLQSESVDLSGNIHQEVTLEVISPVTISSIYSFRGISEGGYSAQLEVNSVIQRTTLFYGTATGLHRITPIQQNACGYVYKLHVGFTNTECGLATCRNVAVGDRIRVRLNICVGVSGECLIGAQRELTVVSRQ